MKVKINAKYELGKSGKVSVVKSSISQSDITEALKAIKEGKKIREVDGPKFYGISCGC